MVSSHCQKLLWQIGWGKSLHWRKTPNTSNPIFNKTGLSSCISMELWRQANQPRSRLMNHRIVCQEDCYFDVTPVAQSTILCMSHKYGHCFLVFYLSFVKDSYFDMIPAARRIIYSVSHKYGNKDAILLWYISFFLSQFLVDSYDLFTQILQDYLTGTGDSTYQHWVSSHESKVD